MNLTKLFKALGITICMIIVGFIIVFSLFNIVIIYPPSLWIIAGLWFIGTSYAIYYALNTE